MQRLQGAGGSGHSGPCPRGHAAGSALARGATAASAGTGRTRGALLEQGLVRHSMGLTLG